jgi:hypothetical protein
MNAISKYQFRQLLNYWHHLRFRIRAEILILFIIFYSFFTDKFVFYFRQVLDHPTTSQLGLSTFILHLLFLIIFLSTPFIYFNLFPKQKGLSNLSLYPLKKSEAITLQIIYFTKYQLLIILIATPILTALTITTGPFILLYILFISFSSLVLSTLMILIIAAVNQNRLRVLTQYYSYLFLYMIFFALMYWLTELFFYTTILVICSAWIILTKYWNKYWQTWDQTLNRYRPIMQKYSQKLSKLTYFNFPFTFLKSLRPFLIKEILSHIRNKNYIRLKIISLILYLSILILIDIFYIDYYTSAISLLTIILIWEHYSHQFNEKYVIKESLFFMKVLPVTYLQYSISKFLSEFLYIILIMIIIFILTLLHNIEGAKIFNVLGIVTVFSVFVLYIITMVRVLFYDNPRLAGYAYHFLIIFTLVMIYNFYLVGPIITFFVILYIQFISYRQFSR